MRTDNVPVWPALHLIPDPSMPTHGAGAVDLATTAFPWTLPAVDDAIRRAVAAPNVYPPVYPRALAGRLATEYLVDQDLLVVGPGSVAVLQQLLQATCKEGDRVVFADPGFDEYIFTAIRTKTRPVPVPLRDGHQDLNALLEAIHLNDARVVILGNPHNPTGTLLPDDAIETFLDRLPRGVLAIVDETYAEFADTMWARRPGTDPRTRNHDNVAALRTFSTAFTLAGLRVGFAITSPPVAAAARRTGPRYSVTQAAQDAAISALDSILELATLWETIRQERALCRDALRDLGYRVPRSHANFLWLDLGEQATTAFRDHCTAHQIRVRTFPSHGARVTISTPEYNATFLDVAETFADRTSRCAWSPTDSDTTKGGEQP